MKKGLCFLIIFTMILSMSNIAMAITTREAIEQGYTEYVSPGVYRKPGTHYVVEVELSETEKKAIAAADKAASSAGNKGFNLDITIDSGASFDTSTVSNTGDAIVDIVGAIAVIIGVVMVIVAGMKYMLAPAGGKADVKSTIMPLLIGGVLVGVAGWIIPSIINSVMSME